MAIRVSGGVFCLLLLAISPLQATEPVEIGKPLPSIEGMDTAGRTIRTGEYRGSTLVLLAAVPADQAGRESASKIGLLSAPRAGRNVCFLHLLHSAALSTCRRFAAHFRLDHPAIVDTGNRSIPGGWPDDARVIVVDPEGIVRWCSNRPLADPEALANLDILLNGIERRFPADYAGFVDAGIRYAAAQSEQTALFSEIEPSMRTAGEDRFVLAARRAAEGGWVLAVTQNLENPERTRLQREPCPGGGTTPLVSAIQPGPPWVIWSDTRLPGENGPCFGLAGLRVTFSDISAAVRISAEAGDVLPCGIAVDPHGAVWIAAEEWVPSTRGALGRKITVRTCTPGGWTAPVLVSPKNATAFEEHADAAVAPDSREGIWVIWIENGQRVWLRSIGDDAQPKAPILLTSPEDRAWKSAPALARLGARALLAAWLEVGPGKEGVRIAVRRIRLTAADPDPLVTRSVIEPDGVPRKIRLFAGGNGEGLVIYDLPADDGTRRLMWHGFDDKGTPGEGTFLDDSLLGEWEMDVDDAGDWWVAAVRDPRRPGDPEAGRLSLRTHDGH